MRMAGASINLQLGHLLTAQAGVRNHAFNSQFQKKFRAASANFTGGVHLLTADVTGETGINFGIFLITGQHHLVRVHNNDKIATVNVGGENCFVLATQNVSRFNGNTAEHLVGSVYNIPLRSTSCGLAEKVFMVQFFVLVFGILPLSSNSGAHS